MSTEPDVVVTPVLSSAKRKFRIGIFEPMDFIGLSGWMIFGFYFVSLIIYVGVIFGILTLIAFFKYGKPDGYLSHLLAEKFRPKLKKPYHQRKTPVFFHPQEPAQGNDQLDKEQLQREVTEQLEWITNLQNRTQRRKRLANTPITQALE